MPVINVPRNFADGDVLLKADIDAISSSVTDLNNTTLYDSENIQNNSITTAKLVDGTVTSAELDSGSITATKILDGNITTAKIGDGEIKTINLADSAVTTAKVASLAVTTAKFNTSNRLSTSKIVAKNTYVGSNASPTTLSSIGTSTIASVTVTNEIRNALIILQPYDTTECYIETTTTSNTGGGVYATISLHGLVHRAGLATGSHAYAYKNRLRIPITSASVLWTSTIAASTTVSATLTWNATNSPGVTGTVTVMPCKLYVIEL